MVFEKRWSLNTGLGGHKSCIQKQEFGHIIVGGLCSHRVYAASSPFPLLKQIRVIIYYHEFCIDRIGVPETIIICVAVTGRKRTLFHSKWVKSISFISIECLVEVTPDFLCPNIELHAQ